MKDVKFDHSAKTITFSYYDVVGNNDGMEALVWADNLSNKRLFGETMTFKTLDGCGNVLYILKFTNLSLLEHKAEFDYSSSDPATTVLTVKYEIIHKQLVACPDEFKRYTWKLLVAGREIPVFVNNRPSVNIEETEISHLNATMFLPGSAKWEPLKLTLSAEDLKSVLDINKVLMGQKFNVDLKLYENELLRETWQLNNVFVVNTTIFDSTTDMEIYYDSVRYLPAELSK
jgi:hypothetical protein